MNRRKLWGIVSIIAVVIIALGVTLATVFAERPAKPEDYAKAAASAQEVAKQYKAFNDAGQGLVNGADAETTAQLKAKLNTAYDALIQSQKELADSTAVKRDSDGSGFRVYNVKAEKFAKLAEQYKVSIPLYADMRETCSQVGKVTTANLLQELQLLSQSILDQSEEGTLARFDARTGDCVTAAKTLQNSGDNSFAQLGGMFATFLSDMRGAIEERFSDAEAVGAEQAKVNYEATSKEDDARTVQTLQSIAKKQKADNDATDFEEELNSLIKTLQSRS